jgi:PAS domain S-box-containing protein
MSVNTPKIISKESFLTYCYEQIINKSNLSEALQNIAHYAVQQLAVTYCQISIQSENEKQVFEAYQQNTAANAIENLKKINNEVVKLPLGIYQINIKNASSEIKSFMHNAGVESILICPFSKNNFQEQFLLAAYTPINWDDYLPIFQQLSLAINNAILTENTKKQLYHRNEIYETTLSVLNKLIWNYDLKTNTVKVTGYSPRTGNYIKEATYQYSELWQKETIHPDDIEKVNLHYQQFLLQKETNKSELVFRMKGKNDNEYIWIKVLQSILRDEQGNPTIIAGTIADLQDELNINLELKKNNEILLQQVQESNEKLNTILNSSKEIILTIDLQTGQIENINNAVAVLGYTPEEWIGQYYTEWTLEKRKKFHDLLKHASKSTTSVKRKQIIFSTKDNKNKIPFEFSTSVFSFKEKKYLLCVLRDITERLEYEKNIEKVTNQLTHLINNIDDVYAIYNIAHKKYEFVSDNIESLYGYSKEDFISNGLFWKDIIHLEDYTSIVKQMEEVINNKGKGEFFYRITNAVGETKMLLEKITVALNKTGKAEKIYIVKSDYTHIENAEQNLIESERKFRFISENITDFISV